MLAAISSPRNTQRTRSLRPLADCSIAIMINLDTSASLRYLAVGHLHTELKLEDLQNKLIFFFHVAVVILDNRVYNFVSYLNAFWSVSLFSYIACFKLFLSFVVFCTFFTAVLPVNCQLACQLQTFGDRQQYGSPKYLSSLLDKHYFSQPLATASAVRSVACL